MFTSGVIERCAVVCSSYIWGTSGVAAVFRCHLALRINFRAVYTLPAVQEGTLARCCSIKRQRPHNTICYSFRTHTMCASKEVLRFVLAKTTGLLHEGASFYRWNTRWVVLRDGVVVCLRCGIVRGVCLQLFPKPLVG